MEKILISVIVPTYNEEKTLSELLESLKNQKTNLSYEVIIVDYNSTDRTRDIVRKSGYKLVIEKKAGRAAARNTGALKAKGEILAFTEADCIVNPNWIEAIGNHLSENPDVIGLSGIYSFYNSSVFYNLLAKIILNFNVIVYRLALGNHSFRGTNFVLRKKFVNKVAGFRNEALPCDDFDMGLRVRKLGPIHHLPEMQIMTSDRRIRDRLFKFLKEFFITYFSVFVLKRRGSDKTFATVR